MSENTELENQDETLGEDENLDELNDGDDLLNDDNGEGEGEGAGDEADGADSQPTPPAPEPAPAAPLTPPAPPVSTAAVPPPVAPAFQGANQTGVAAKVETERDFGIRYGKRQAAVKDRLDKQPKVAFMIPRNPLEIDGLAYETVQIDGFRMEIKKGVMVHLPQQVAEILAEKFNIETTAGNDKVLGRSQEVTDALT